VCVFIAIHGFACPQVDVICVPASFLEVYRAQYFSSRNERGNFESA